MRNEAPFADPQKTILASGGQILFAIVNGQPVQGVKKIVYTFSVSQPGTYAFRCDFHANMTGTLTVK